MKNHNQYRSYLNHAFSFGVQIRTLISIFTLVYFLGFILFSDQAFAKNDKQDYLNSQFDNNIPLVKRLWINDQLKQTIKTQHNPSQIKLSYRYWKNENKTVWILDEIGKERNITTGISIENHAITSVEIITYRESRGGQVQNNRFTSQYLQKDLESNLSKEIDSISGATLSVLALNKQVNLALWLNQQIEQFQH